MNFKNILETLDQLSEGVKEKEGGRVHTADPGGYGRKFDTDEEGDEKKDDKKKEPAVKRGRGRPKKGADDSGEVKKYDNAKNLQDFMIGNKPKKSKELDKLPAKKHSLKEWVEEVEQKFVAENVPPGMKPMAILDPKNQQAGAGVITSTNPTIQKMLGNLDPKDTKVVMTTPQAGTTTTQPAAAATGQAPAGTQPMKEKWAGDAKIHATGEYAKKSVAELKAMLAKLKKTGPHDENSPEAKKQRQINFALRSKGGWKKGEGAAMKEGDIPSTQGIDTKGAGLGAGRSQATFEAKKPDANKNGIPDYAEDGKGKNDLKKKKVKEGMDHKLQAARLEGKAHGLKGHAYHGKAFEDLEEMRAYHEGYKEGLDECYGMKPIQGMVDEMNAPATVPGMASQEEEMAAMEADMMEVGRGEYMKQQAKATPGDTFKAFGQTFKDAEVLENDPVFESWDRELTSLINEGKEEVAEGLTVSISKGQQGAPDSVTVSAQDGEADQLLGLIKQAGLGLFGDEQHSDYGAPEAGDDHGGIKVVGDHDGMMGIMKRLSGIEQSGSGDYADEEGYDEHEHDEEACNECGGMGMHESGCSAGGGKEMVDEVETEDQMAAQVAEQGADSGAEDSVADEDAEAAEDAALAGADSGNDEEVTEEEDEEGLNEWANNAGDKGTDAAFERDIEFMTKVISGGLNKPKSTGQTTTPVIASQLNRQHSHETTDINESITDWKKLAGIK